MLLRRTDDTGIQAVLSAIEGVNDRIGQIDRNLMRISSSVAVHENEINTMKKTSEGRIDKWWMVAVASVGLLPTLFGWFVKWIRGG